MHKIIKEKFIKKYWFDIIETDSCFSVFNTKRKKNKIDRDGIGHEVSFFKTLKEAEEFLEKYEKDGYDVQDIIMPDDQNTAQNQDSEKNSIPPSPQQPTEPTRIKIGILV